jgi:hypothetical protein
MRDRLIGALVVMYLLVHLAVPMVMLFRARPQRFGWQMFTTEPVFPWLVIHRRTGARDTVDANIYFANRRADLATGFLHLVGPHVCRVTAGVTVVELWLRRDSAPRLHSCP